MPVRPMRPEELPAAIALGRKLWPDSSVVDFAREQVMVWEENGHIGGFVSYSLRSDGDGAENSPCPWVEGWFVEEDLRRNGIGRALIAAVEAWCLENGYVELGSDALLDNTVSKEAHQRLGFRPVEQIQIFNKRLRP
ncbi:MAG: GNAT family N-acetyltransferase [Alphaproteobacteria bacterium]